MVNLLSQGCEILLSPKEAMLDYERGLTLILTGVFVTNICQGAASSWRLRPCSVSPCRRNQDCPAGVQQSAKLNFMYQMFMTTWHLPAGDTLGGCGASQAGESNVFPSSHHSSLALAFN